MLDSWHQPGDSFGASFSFAPDESTQSQCPWAGGSPLAAAAAALQRMMPAAPPPPPPQGAAAEVEGNSAAPDAPSASAQMSGTWTASGLDGTAAYSVAGADTTAGGATGERAPVLTAVTPAFRAHRFVLRRGTRAYAVEHNPIVDLFGAPAAATERSPSVRREAASRSASAATTSTASPDPRRVPPPFDSPAAVVDDEYEQQRLRAVLAALAPLPGDHAQRMGRRLPPPEL